MRLGGHVWLWYVDGAVNANGAFLQFVLSRALESWETKRGVTRRRPTSLFSFKYLF